jgi:hypothetical protein
VLPDEPDSFSEISIVWNVLKSLFEIKQHDSCSTHVHIGLEEGWSLKTLKMIVKGSLWVEEEIRDVMPNSRKFSIWAMPNCLKQYDETFAAANKMVQLYKHAVKEDDFSDLFQYIDEADDLDSLIDRVAPERSLSWNLQNTRGTCNTVEFRRPPQCMDASDCMKWINLALSLAKWSLTADFDNEQELGNLTSIQSGSRAN